MIVGGLSMFEMLHIANLIQHIHKNIEDEACGLMNIYFEFILIMVRIGKKYP